MREAILLLHPTLAMLSVISAIWVIVETLNASPANLNRLKNAAKLVAILMFLTCLVAGYYYVNFYAPDKAIILKGSWKFAHNLIMESKEHLFFMTLILSFLLPVVASAKDIVSSKQTRTLIVSIAGLIVLSSLALEGAGSVIAMGVKMGLLQTLVK
ncbi:MAG: hypothetical protein WCG08_06915 [Paludibacter sp.]